MPALTRRQAAQRPEELYQPLFFEAQAQPKPHPRQRKSKKIQQTFDENQIEASQPLLTDPLNMYPQDPQAMAQQTLNNVPTMRFPPNTYPTHGMVQWSPNFEPIFVPMPLGGGSVPTSLEDEQSHSFEFSQPNTSNIQQGIVHLSDDSDTDYGITNEEMARAFQDKSFRKNFKCIVAQEIVKFNPNLEGPKSKNQTNTTIEKIQPMINLDLDKGKQPLEFSNAIMAPIRSHQEPTIEILQSTFEHINVNPLFDEIPPIPKHPKRTLRLDFSHMMQQQDAPKGTHALGMLDIPSLEANQQSTPLLLILPSATTSNTMEPLINTTCETSSATIPMDTQRKSLIDITPIPNRNVSHSQVNMMLQAGTSKTKMYQNNNTNMTFNSQGLSQPP